MGYVPNINNPSKRAETDPDPQVETVGTVRSDILQPGPIAPQAVWQGPSGVVDLSEAPPPWEVGDAAYRASDAKQFVSVPDDWTLRWINTKVLDASGWRHWQPVMASDPRVTIKVQTLVAPDNTVRRGGGSGDVLAWMPQHWVEARRKHQQALTARRTQSAVDRQGQLREDFRRGKYGRGVTLEDAKHPTHTMADGRTMEKT